MDLLYITQQTKEELLQFCEQSLIDYVLNDFQRIGKIIVKENYEKPSRWWIITDYICDNVIDKRKKLSVIMSLAVIKGFIQIDEQKVFGYTKTLLMLKEKQCISEEDLNYFEEWFCNYQDEQIVKFSI